MEDAAYFSGLTRFQKEYQYLLRVFTLNYDLCIEKACAESGVERGFGDGKIWELNCCPEAGQAHVALLSGRHRQLAKELLITRKFDICEIQP